MTIAPRRWWLNGTTTIWHHKGLRFKLQTCWRVENSIALGSQTHAWPGESPTVLGLHLLVMMKVLLSLIQTHWWTLESPTILGSNLLVTLWKSHGLRFKPIGDWPHENPTILGSNLLGTLWKSYGLRFKPIGDRPSQSPYCFRFKPVGDPMKVLWS